MTQWTDCTFDAIAADRFVLRAWTDCDSSRQWFISTWILRRYKLQISQIFFQNGHLETQNEPEFGQQRRFWFGPLRLGVPKSRQEKEEISASGWSSLCFFLAMFPKKHFENFRDLCRTANSLLSADINWNKVNQTDLKTLSLTLI